MKKPFPASLTFAFLMCCVLGGVSAVAFVVLRPTGAGIDNGQIISAFGIAAWAAGPVTALLSFIGICILNAIRRIVRMRNVNVLHPIVVLIGIVPWLVFSWVILDEPRYTQFAIAAQDFVARPMLWGSLVATIMTVLLSIPLFTSKKK